MGRPRLWTPVFVAVLFVALCCFTVGQGINSGTSVYIGRLGGTAALAGMGAAVFSIAAAVARIVCGPLIDTKGRVIVMGVGSVIFLVGVLGSAISASLDLFVLWRVLQGIGFSTTTTAAATAAADVLPAERLGEGIGYYGLGQAVGMSLGPALGLFFVTSEPAENLYWGMAAFAILAIAVSTLCRYEKRPEQLPETATYRVRAAKQTDGDGASDSVNLLGHIVEPGALAGALPMAVLSPAVGFVVFFAGLFGTSLGVGSAGIFYTVGAATMVAVRLLSGSFMDRVAGIRIFALACACGIVAYAMMLFVSLGTVQGVARDALFYCAGVPYGVCLGVALPVNQAMAVKNSSAERWGAANAMFLLVYDIGIGAGTALWGVTNDAFGFTFTIGCILVLIVVSFGVALLTYPASEKR